MLLAYADSISLLQAPNADSDSISLLPELLTLPVLGSVLLPELPTLAVLTSTLLPELSKLTVIISVCYLSS